jgi:hypothetical protein
MSKVAQSACGAEGIHHFTFKDSKAVFLPASQDAGNRISHVPISLVVFC